MFCGQCSIENAEGLRYCVGCGADLESMRTPSGRTPPAGTAPPSSSASAPGSLPGRTTVLPDEAVADLSGQRVGPLAADGQGRHPEPRRRGSKWPALVVLLAVIGGWGAWNAGLFSGEGSDAVPVSAPSVLAAPERRASQLLAATGGPGYLNENAQGYEVYERGRTARGS